MISPASEYIYRDSGLKGDSVSEQVVRSIPPHMQEGGFATIAISWIANPGSEATAPVQRWLSGSGCDAWLLHYRTDTPLETAAVWNSTESGDATRYAQLIDTWLAYYRDLGIRGIAYGSLVLRRRDGANWFRTDPLPAGRLKPASDHILGVFAAQNIPRRRHRTPKLLLGERVRVAPKATVGAAHSIPREANRTVERDDVLTLDEGVGFQAGMDAAGAGSARRSSTEGERCARRWRRPRNGTGVSRSRALRARGSTGRRGACSRSASLERVVQLGLNAVERFPSVIWMA